MFPPVAPPMSPPVAPPMSPPEAPPESCAAALAAVLARLRELEGHVRALRGHCGDTGGPQAGTGRDQGRCERGRCRCFPGFSGPDCGTPACAPGWGGVHCDIEVPAVTPRLATRTSTSLRVTWPRPSPPPDGYRVTLVPLDDPMAMTTHELPGSAVAFSVTGLSPGRPFELLVQARRGPHLGAAGVLRLRTALVLAVPPPTRGPQGPLRVLWGLQQWHHQPKGPQGHWGPQGHQHRLHHQMCPWVHMGLWGHQHPPGLRRPL
ncbi:tenascin-X-like [Corapipo altera]|uniref:tenascin-X-like n=1 Tax=Corapipo altera TaxID=415028 RepID=UPI000FD63C2B|nr:tenascin-X-like [Corapipo altera]